jgi:dTDP-4-amino-4,6-dideoxygalactose transaminase
MALLLGVRWFVRQGMNSVVEIPKRTYVSVPMSIIHAGAIPMFRDEEWVGAYQLKPWPLWDSARAFTSNMVGPGQMVCVSFHASKTLGLEQGGAILHDNPHADVWFRKMRFDCRTEGVSPKDDTFDEIGYHCYMNPSTAAQGILKLHSLPKHNPPLPNDDYPDLSQMEAFQ